MGIAYPPVYGNTDDMSYNISERGGVYPNYLGRDTATRPVLICYTTPMQVGPSQCRLS